MEFDPISKNIVGEHAIDAKVAYSPEVVGKECVGCMKALPFIAFPADHTYRDGRRDLCSMCAAAPRMSTAEHTHRLREMTFNSAAVRAQRWAHQDDYRNDASRIGHQMTGIEFLGRLKSLVPSLYCTDGRIIGDIAVFRTYGFPQTHLEGRTFEYLWYVPSGIMPEFSLYEFDTVRDIPIKEKKRGWRTPLLRCIKAGLLTEEQAEAEFGPAQGSGSTVWHRQLYAYRNRNA